MKKQRILSVAFLTFIVMACEETNPNLGTSFESTSPPAITSIVPESAECGTEIILYGDNFGAGITDNYVTFDTWGSEAHSGRIAEVTKVPQSGVVMVRIPLNLVPGDYNISLQAKGKTSIAEKVFKVME